MDFSTLTQDIENWGEELHRIISKEALDTLSRESAIAVADGHKEFQIQGDPSAVGLEVSIVGQILAIDALDLDFASVVVAQESNQFDDVVYQPDRQQ